ncbi:MAG: GGDEF domain-containing protein, partial [Burkholderiaceae bacterium]|nr:GGDEF domain-containing protein [Burkholderiaceae bacterium]
MRFHSLESRVVVLFISLLLTLQLVAYFAIGNAIDTNARSAIESELKISTKVFSRLLDQNAQKLIQGATLLSKDYAFREAIGTHDTETIVSTLLNHGQRLGADLTMLVDLDGKITAASSDTLAHGLQQSVSSMIKTATEKGSAGNIDIVDGKPYQMVMVPVLAPVTISWVVMAIPLDQTLVSDMRELSKMQISLLTSQNRSPWKMNVSTLEQQDALQLASALPKDEAGSGLMRDMEIGDNRYRTNVLPLAS